MVCQGVSDLCNSKPEQAQTCAVGILWPRDKLSRDRGQAVTEDSTGSSYLVLPHVYLYLKQRQEVLM